jgi:hypothetical protein
MTETELQQAIDKIFILTCLNYGKYNQAYSPENIEALEQAAQKLAQFCRASKLNLYKKLEHLFFSQKHSLNA